jgi:hypothetical protein
MKLTGFCFSLFNACLLCTSFQKNILLSIRKFILHCSDSNSFDIKKPFDRPLERISFDKYVGSYDQFVHGLQTRAIAKIPVNNVESADISKLLMHFGSSMKADDFSISINALAEMKSVSPSWSTIDEFHSVTSPLNKLIQQFTMDEMAHLMSNLGRMGISWIDIEKESRFIDKLGSMLSSLREQQLVDVIWALGITGARSDDLSKQIQSGLIDALIKNFGQFSAFSFSSSLWSLAKMGTRWNSFPPTLRSIIASKTQAIAGGLSPQQSSKVVWALGMLGAQRTLVSIAALERLVLRIGDIKKSQMGNAFTASSMFVGLAKMGVSWSDFSPEMQCELRDQLSRVLQAFDSKVAVTLYSVLLSAT